MKFAGFFFLLSVAYSNPLNEEESSSLTTTISEVSVSSSETSSEEEEDLVRDRRHLVGGAVQLCPVRCPFHVGPLHVVTDQFARQWPGLENQERQLIENLLQTLNPSLGFGNPGDIAKHFCSWCARSGSVGGASPSYMYGVVSPVLSHGGNSFGHVSSLHDHVGNGYASGYSLGSGGSAHGGGHYGGGHYGGGHYLGGHYGGGHYGGGQYGGSFVGGSGLGWKLSSGGTQAQTSHSGTVESEADMTKPNDLSNMYQKYVIIRPHQRMKTIQEQLEASGAVDNLFASTKHGLETAKQSITVVPTVVPAGQVNFQATVKPTVVPSLSTIFKGGMGGPNNGAYCSTHDMHSVQQMHAVVPEQVQQIAPMQAVEVHQVAPMHHQVQQVVPVHHQVQQVVPVHHQVQQVVPVHHQVQQEIHQVAPVHQQVQQEIHQVAPVHHQVQQVIPVHHQVQQVVPVHHQVQQVVPVHHQVQQEIHQVAPVHQQVQQEIHQVAPVHHQVQQVVPVHHQVQQEIHQVAPVQQIQSIEHKTPVQQMHPVLTKQSQHQELVPILEHESHADWIYNNNPARFGSEELPVLNQEIGVGEWSSGHDITQNSIQDLHNPLGGGCVMTQGLGGYQQCQSEQLINSVQQYVPQQGIHYAASVSPSNAEGLYIEDLGGSGNIGVSSSSFHGGEMLPHLVNSFDSKLQTMVGGSIHGGGTNFHTHDRIGCSNLHSYINEGNQGPLCVPRLDLIGSSIYGSGLRQVKVQQPPLVFITPSPPPPASVATGSICLTKK